MIELIDLYLSELDGALNYIVINKLIKKVICGTMMMMMSLMKKRRHIDGRLIARSRGV